MPDPDPSAGAEIERGERFAFGRNWRSFVEGVTEERVVGAVASLRGMLGGEDLRGRLFLDVGCGSGLSSLAARRLGARVHAFDFDPECVDAASLLRERFAPGDADWTIEQGSILDPDYLSTLPRADVVYAWGVLHHTGRMWEALDRVRALVPPRGLLFIAIYHDTGRSARRWAKLKKRYCASTLGRLTVMGRTAPRKFVLPFLRDVVRLRSPLRRYREHRRKRGMSRYHDWIDWLGGHPYEFARPEEILRFFAPRGFTLENMSLTHHDGCNEFVFRRDRPARTDEP